MPEVQHVSVYIARRPAEVNEFASDSRTCRAGPRGWPGPRSDRTGMSGSRTRPSVSSGCDLCHGTDSASWIMTSGWSRVPRGAVRQGPGRRWRACWSARRAP